MVSTSPTHSPAKQNWNTTKFWPCQTGQQTPKKSSNNDNNLLLPLQPSSQPTAEHLQFASKEAGKVGGEQWWAGGRRGQITQLSNTSLKSNGGHHRSAQSCALLMLKKCSLAAITRPPKCTPPAPPLPAAKHAPLPYCQPAAQPSPPSRAVLHHPGTTFQLAGLGSD